MVRFITLVISVLVFFVSNLVGLFSETFVFSANTANDLSLKSVSVVDSKTLKVTFSNDVDPETIVLKITKQSDNSSVKMTNVKIVTSDPTSVNVSLDEDLQEASSYTVTAIAAIGKNGSTITDGSAALQDFVTPSPLKKAEESLNAPSNPHAVITTDEKPANITSEQKPTSSPVVKPTPDPIPVTTEELPLAGMNPLVLLLIVLPISYFLLKRRHSHS